MIYVAPNYIVKEIEQGLRTVDRKFFKEEILQDITVGVDSEEVKGKIKKYLILKCASYTEGSIRRFKAFEDLIKYIEKQERVNMLGETR